MTNALFVCIQNARRPQMDLDDPVGRPLQDVRRIRDDIARRVDALIEELAPSEGVAS